MVCRERIQGNLIILPDLLMDSCELSLSGAFFVFSREGAKTRRNRSTSATLPRLKDVAILQRL